MLRALRCTIFSSCRGPAANALIRFVLVLVLVLVLVCLCLAGSCWFWILNRAAQSQLLFWRRHAPPRLGGVLPAFGTCPFATQWREGYRKQGSMLFLA
jgi:hypothetical protein